MNNKTVSIIIPVYNVSPYLEKCLQSVIRQTYKELQIIIIDDGSTDGSSDICDKYQKIDGRIIVIHKKNEGQSSARNEGLDKMTGVYFMFLDSDDWLALDTCERLVNHLECKQLDIVHFGYEKVKEESVISDIGGEITNTWKLTKKFFYENLVTGKCKYTVWSSIYRTEKFGHIRFIPNLIYEDVFYTNEVLNCSFAGEVCDIKYYRYLCVRAGNTNTKRFNPSLRMPIIQELIRVEKTLHVNPSDTSVLNSYRLYCMGFIKDLYILAYNNSAGAEILYYLKNEYNRISKQITSWKLISIKTFFHYAFFRISPASYIKYINLKSKRK